MDSAFTQDKTSIDLTRLEGQVDRLLLLCEQLRAENRLLRERQVALIAERARLTERNAAARTRVESIIGRLQGLENDA